jgi:hypothetical protein
MRATKTIASGTYELSKREYEDLIGRDIVDYYRSMAVRTLFPDATTDQVEQIMTFARSIGVLTD